MQNDSAIIPLQAIVDDITKEHNIRLFVLRLDLNHPRISGNKLYKLKYNLEEAKKQNKKTLLTFGGAFSNHIAATAAAGKEYEFDTIGIIRGEEYEELNPTLKFAAECGMKLFYISRTLYQNKNELYNYIEEQFSSINYYLIPEGGSNELGIKGCKEIVNDIKIDFDFVCCPCGTGTTLSGLILSLKENQTAIGFQVLKAENYIKEEVENWLEKLNFSYKKNWIINEDYHFGGYAKTKPELVRFIEKFEKKNNVSLDYIYTGKMMFGLYNMIQNGYFKSGQTIVAIHTGGLQGNKGFELTL
jgi:1-aminocyclopropane-1-carboxylate deaminase